MTQGGRGRRESVFFEENTRWERGDAKKEEWGWAPERSDVYVDEKRFANSLDLRDGAFEVKGLGQNDLKNLLHVDGMRG